MPDKSNPPRAAQALDAVPAQDPESRARVVANAAPRYTTRQILDPLNQAIAPIDIPPLYRVSVFFVAITMVLLPMFYVGLIGLGLCGLLWHLIGNAWMLAEGPGAWIMYLRPALLGGLAVVFMLKPLFASPAKPAPTYSLDRNHERLLFDFVERLCRCVGAPVPQRIDVVTDTNASASFRSGFASMFSDDLVLTIGLPLVAKLSLRQFAGVLAHEFGHFTQGSAMRFGYVVGSVNNWFARVVFERDTWDEYLTTLSHLHQFTWLLLLPVRLAVWLNRRILWCLMYVAHMLSCFMSRQMEYDADLHEIRVAGSDQFESTSMELHILGVALSMAFQDLEESWREKRLGDDLPALVVANTQYMRTKPDALEKIKKAVLDDKAGWFDTHPATADRIERAHAEQSPGIYQVNAPAHILFHDFGALCRALTLEYYHEALESDVTAENLVPTADLVAEQTETNETLKTLYRYFQGKVVGAIEVFLPPQSGAPPDSPRRTLELLKQSRQRMVDALPEIAEAVKRFDKADERLRELAQISVALDAGFSFRADDIGLHDNRLETVRQARRAAEVERADSLRHLNLITGDARNRLIAGLQLLQVPPVVARLDDGQAKQTRAAQLLGILRVLESTWPQVLRLREVGSVLNKLIEHVEDNTANAALFSQIEKLSGAAAQTMHAIRNQLGGGPYPFQHARKQISIADHAVPEVPPADEVGDILSAAYELLDKMVNLYYRVMAHLAVTAEQVESAADLAPLPEPPEEEEEDEEDGEQKG